MLVIFSLYPLVNAYQQGFSLTVAFVSYILFIVSFLCIESIPDTRFSSRDMPRAGFGLETDWGVRNALISPMKYDRLRAREKNKQQGNNKETEEEGLGAEAARKQGMDDSNICR